MATRFLAGTIVVAGMLATGAGQAAQAGGQITVVSAGSTAAHAGLLSVTLESTSPVVPGSITAEMFAPGASSPALTVDDFELTAGNNTGGTSTTWTVPAPITQAQLALGSYTIAVQASDTGGDEANSTNAGTLAFIVYPTVTLSISPANISYGQTVTLSGSDTGLYPDGTTQPVPAGQQINFLGTITTTDNAGHYRLTMQAGFGDGFLLYLPIDVEAVDNTTTARAFSNSVTASVTPAPLRFTGLTAKQNPITFGTGVSLSGTASYQVGTTWLPLADFGHLGAYAYGTVESPSYGYQGPWATATDSNGAFTATINGPMDTTSYRFGIDALYNSTPWFKPGPESIRVPAIHVPTLFSYFIPSARPGGHIRFRGCVDAISSWNFSGPYPVQLLDPFEMAPYPKAKFQYSASKKGPWRTVPGAGAVTAFRAPGPPKYIRGCYQITVRRPSHAAWFRFFLPASTAWKGTESRPAKP